MSRIRILRLSIRCPGCGAPPRLRTGEDWVAFLRDHCSDPELVVQSYECHIRHCSERYEIKVKHFHVAA